MYLADAEFHALINGDRLRQPSKLLIIDDDRSLHALVRAELLSEGFGIHSAFDGLTGVNLARKVRPDLILLDVSMPEIDGYDVCELIRIQVETANTPVIFLSATADPAERARGLNAGAVDFITKPFFGDELRARVRVSLRFKFLLDLETNRALRDGLTGAWNRAYFEDCLKRESAAVARHHYPLSCVMLDIDRFKLINDNYGHPFGDRVICGVVEALNRTCREEDIVCRYGGEEFVVLCPHVAEDGAHRLAERMREAVLQNRFETPSGNVTVTCSLGVADERHGLGAELVSAADRALFIAKRSGRNRTCGATTTEFPADAFVPSA